MRLVAVNDRVAVAADQPELAHQPVQPAVEAGRRGDRARLHAPPPGQEHPSAVESFHGRDDPDPALLEQGDQPDVQDRNLPFTRPRVGAARRRRQSIRREIADGEALNEPGDRIDDGDTDP